MEFFLGSGIALSLVGLPNSMLLFQIAKGDAEGIQFWRKFIFYEELIFTGIVATTIVTGALNSDDDIYPPNDPYLSEKEESSLDALGRNIAVISLLVFTGSTLLNLVPFSAELKQLKMDAGVKFDTFTQSRGIGFLPGWNCNISYGF